MTLNLFISYRSTDSAKVDTLVSRLRGLTLPDGSPRFHVWQDKTHITAGEDWWQAIVNGIIDAQILVYMVSHDSVINPNCRAELSYARKRGRAILPVVLADEFTYNPRTGKPDIGYWDDLPAELNDLRAQFLFDTGTATIDGVMEACETFAAKGFHDFPRDFPPDPRLDSTDLADTVAIYDHACDAALKMDIATAERWFQRLVDWHDPDFGAAAHAWMKVLGLYEKLVRLAGSRSGHFRAVQVWAEYVEMWPLPYMDFFDPQGLQARYDTAPPAPPSIEVTPPRGGSQTQAPLPPPAPRPLTLAEASAAVQAIIGEPFAWCEVPAGPFLMGSDRKKDKNAQDWEPDLHQVTLPTFWIAKYPITYSQFQTFVEAGDGYHDDRWWQGLAASAGDRKLAQPRWKIANHPRETVNWYQAMAFCRWLSQRLGGSYAVDGVAEWAIRLPIEAEWEKAARGTDGRIYPWGNTFDNAKCNTRVSGNGQTTPVDQYPQGASPYGLLNMSGNVWEWSLSGWTHPYDHHFVLEIEIPYNTPRVARGGSWLNGNSSVRVAFRVKDFPGSCSYDLGFRVVGSGNARAGI